jgi:hypothetical protein
MYAPTHPIIFYYFVFAITLGHGNTLTKNGTTKGGHADCHHNCAG